VKLHETDDGFFCFLDEPTDSILWLAFFRSRETALRAWELAQASAAAPDLLAALVDMTDRYARAMKDSGVSHYPEAMVEIRSARAAIAKATGGAA